MKAILVLASLALFASAPALACDDLSHHTNAQAKAPEAPAVIAEKAQAPQVTKKPVAKAKTPAKSVAQANVPATRTVVN